jgi:hypothetical protein
MYVPIGLIGAQSVGQVVAAIRAEASALGLDARFIRVTIDAPETNARQPSRVLGWILLMAALGLIIAAMWHG